MFFKKPTFWLTLLHVVVIGAGAAASVYAPGFAPVIAAVAAALTGAAPSPIITRQPPNTTNVPTSSLTP